MNCRTNQGTIAEHLLLTELLSRGMEVYRPVVDTFGADMVVRTSSGYKKIQVKSTTVQNRKDAYKFNLSRGHTNRNTNRGYESDEFDFAAFYMFDLDVWYIIPYDVVGSRTTLRLHPYSVKSKYTKYFNAFFLLE